MFAARSLNKYHSLARLNLWFHCLQNTIEQALINMKLAYTLSLAVEQSIWMQEFSHEQTNEPKNKSYYENPKYCTNIFSIESKFLSIYCQIMNCNLLLLLSVISFILLYFSRFHFYIVLCRYIWASDCVHIMWVLFIFMYRNDVIICKC